MSLCPSPAPQLIVAISLASLLSACAPYPMYRCASDDHEHDEDADDEDEDLGGEDGVAADDDDATDPLADDDDATDTPGDDDDATDAPDSVECTYEGFPALLHQATIDEADPLHPLFLYQARDSEAAPFNELQVASYMAEPYFGPSSPGTYSLEGSNYATCALCVVLVTGCDDGYSCDTVFFADAGTVDIVAMGDVGTPFSAVLEDVVFQEVSLNPTTYESTPVPGGDTWCVDGFTMDLTTQQAL